MIQVSVKRQSKSLLSLSIKGHAGVAKVGENLICAGVSSVSYGLLNAIDELAPNTCDIIIDDGYIEISILKATKNLDIIINTGIIQLRTMQESYPDLIRIMEEII